MERVMGLEPMRMVWKTAVLPLNYTCLKLIRLATVFANLASGRF